MSETPEIQPSAEADAAQDLDGVLGTALSIAQENLAQMGGIMPFAVVLENEATVARRIAENDDTPEEGEPSLRMVLVEPTGDDEDAEIDGGVIVAELLEALRAQRGDLAAAAVVSDVTLLEADTDAIHVEAVHVLGPTAALVQPYTLGESGPVWGQLDGDTPEGLGIWDD